MPAARNPMMAMPRTMKPPQAKPSRMPRPVASVPTFFMKAYHEGGVVGETGPAFLEKGEKVIPKSKVVKTSDKKPKSRAASALSTVNKKANTRKAAKEKTNSVKHMHIHKTDNNRFTADHFDERPEPDSIPKETHAFNDTDELKEHVGQVMGGGSSLPSNPMGA